MSTAIAEPIPPQHSPQSDRDSAVLAPQVEADGPDQELEEAPAQEEALTGHLAEPAMEAAPTAMSPMNGVVPALAPMEGNPETAQEEEIAPAEEAPAELEAAAGDEGAPPAEGSGGEGSEGAPTEGGEGLGEGAAAIDVALPTGNTQEYTQSLMSQKPSGFLQGMKQADQDVQSAFDSERSTLQDSLPEVEQPTGLPTISERAKEAAATQSEQAAQELQQNNGEVPVSDPEGKKEGHQIEENVEQAPSSVLDTIKNFFNFSFFGDNDSGKSQVQQGITQLPTSDNVETDPGVAPEVDMTGQANPAQNQQNLETSDASVAEEQAANKAESQLYKGEDDIYPEMELEMLRPTVELTEVEAAPSLEDELPPASQEVMDSFDTSMQSAMDEQIAPEKEKQEAEFEKMQADQEAERLATDVKIEEETTNVRAQQETAQQQAQADVAAHRESWQAENEAVRQEYANQSEAEKARIDQEIDTKVQETDAEIATEYENARTEADSEVASTEAEAERQRAEAEKQSNEKSWWDRAMDAVSDFFDALKEGLNKLFDGLRSLVKGIIEAAKKLANKLIDFARDAIVGMIKAFGEVLKRLANIALAAFPELRDKFNAMIDSAVELAKEAVNALAEGLKKAVSALLDVLGAVLDAILAAYQAYYNLLLDALKFITVGLMKVLQFLWNLVEGAWYAPGEFLGALAKEALGGDPSEPLPNFEVPEGQEDQWAAAMGLPEGETEMVDEQVSEQIPDEMMSLFTKDELADSDVVLEPDPAIEMDPELLDQIYDQVPDGGRLDMGGAESDSVTTEEFQASAADASGFDLSAFAGDPVEQGTDAVDQAEASTEEMAGAEGGGSGPDWRNMSDNQKLDHYLAEMLKPNEEAASQEPSPTTEQPTEDLDNTPEVLMTKTGRLSIGERLGFMGKQMLTGIQVLWNKYKVWIITALVTALLIAGAIAFVSGGTALAAAVDIIVKALIIIFGAIAVMKSLGYIWDYVKYAWAGDTKKAGESLASAIAVIIVEFFIDKILIGMGKVFKRIAKSAKAAVKAQLKATKTGRRVLAGALKTRRFAQTTLRRGISRVKNSRLVVNMGGKVGRGIKKLEDLRAAILDRFKFKGTWFEKHGEWLELWAQFNAKVLMIVVSRRGGKTTYSHRPKRGAQGIGRRVSDQQLVVSQNYLDRLDQLKIDYPDKYQEALRDLLAKHQDDAVGLDEMRALVDERVRFPTRKNPAPRYTADEIADFQDIVNSKYTFSDELRDKARQVHDMLRAPAGKPQLGVEKSTVAIARVRKADGTIELFASGNGAKLTGTQRDKLIELGVPESNIFMGPKAKVKVDGDTGTFTKLANHAERSIENNLPQGSQILEWGISWSKGQKNAMCRHCLAHFAGK